MNYIMKYKFHIGLLQEFSKYKVLHSSIFRKIALWCSEINLTEDLFRVSMVLEQIRGRLPSHFDRPSRRWIPSPWKRNSWTSNTEVSGCHWLARGETSADTYASSSVSSVIRKGSYIGTDCFRLALTKNVCNYFASSAPLDQSMVRSIPRSDHFRIKKHYNTRIKFSLYTFPNFVQSGLPFHSYEDHVRSVIINVNREAQKISQSRAWSESDLRHGAKLRNKSGARHERAILHEEKYENNRDTSDLKSVKKVLPLITQSENVRRHVTLSPG